MSFNRLMYDSCAYKKTLEESTGTLSYVLNPIKYENCSKCRVEFGVVGGTNVSHNKGNLVDVENELFNITRKTSKCPTKKYIPKCDKKGANNFCQVNYEFLPEFQLYKYHACPLSRWKESWSV